MRYFTNFIKANQQATDMENCNCEGCELKSLFFQHVSEDMVQTICARKSQFDFKKGDIIIREGEVIKDFIYLKNGLVKLYRSGTNDREQIIAFALPLDFVSLLSIFSESRYHYSVSALENSTTCNIRLEEVKSLAEVNAKFTLNLIQKINGVTDKIIINTLDIRQKRLMGRVAYFLLYFSNDVYHSLSFDLPVSRKEIADFIGMTMENVIRTLSDFKKDGIIKTDGSKIQILNKDSLTRISEMN